MKEKIRKIENEVEKLLKNSKTLEDIESIRIKYLGKKSELSNLLKSLKNLTQEEKKEIGPLANNTRKNIHSKINKKKELLEENFDAETEWIDVSAPGNEIKKGSLSPLSIVQQDIENIFTAIGFEVADGPEIESEYFNFDAANVSSDHPARDMQDTFWIKTDSGKGDGQVLRTHTTNCQVRYMQTHTPPFRIIVPGRVFRQEATDASHEHTFHQFEALVVGKNVSVANFLSVAKSFFSAFFGKDISVRVRPSYFPFVEPGFEFDISCTNCGGKGCSTCQQTGWLEIGGAGMVHQNVLVEGGYKRDEYTGFAWGFGLERLAMMKYKINDIRLFHSGDTRFGRQF